MLFLALLSSCGATNETTGRAPQVAVQAAEYPDGLQSTLGVSSTPEFLADTVTAAADEFGKHAPAILKLGNLVPDRQLTVGTSTAAVITEKLGPWIEKQTK